MNNNKSIYMICAGGHARVIIDIMQQAGQLISGILDNNISLSGSNIFGVSVLGTEDYILSLNPHEVLLVNGLGNNPKGKVTDLNARFLLFEKFYGFNPLSITNYYFLDCWFWCKNESHDRQTCLLKFMNEYKKTMKRVYDLTVGADDYPTRLKTSLLCLGEKPAPPPPIKPP